MHIWKKLGINLKCITCGYVWFVDDPRPTESCNDILGKYEKGPSIPRQIMMEKRNAH